MPDRGKYMPNKKTINAGIIITVTCKLKIPVVIDGMLFGINHSNKQTGLKRQSPLSFLLFVTALHY